MGVIDIMNMVKLRGVASCIFLIILLTSAMVFIYSTVSTTIVGIIKGEDYILYDPKQIPLFLLLPVMVLMDLSFIYLLFPFMPCKKKVVTMIEQKLMIPVTIYAIAALAIGLILSIVISVYPLGTDYYQCDSTSIVSSGSHYARTKEMCKQRAYSAETDQEQSSATSDITSGTGSSNPERDK
ncbi:TPA: hypothetical protein KWI17_003205 [Enterobacter cloacae]|nr:hypothetical protein [Enterobacter cloacae]